MINESKKKTIKILTAAMVLVLIFTAFTGCSGNQVSAAAGTLILKVNPEFEISYDANGDVISIMPINEDAGVLMEQVTSYEGKPASEVIPELVKLIDKEGYINKQIKGEGKNINIEVKYGSTMPDEAFLQDIVSNVKALFDDKKVTGKVIVSGESNYGISQYEVSDYGNTDYKAVKSKIEKSVNNGNSYTDYGNTDYDGYNSDYGSNTDYDGNNTDYNSNYGGNSNYSSNSNYSNYNSNPTSGASNNTNYSNYNDSAYDSDSDYKAPAKPTSGTTATKPTSGAGSNYSDYNSNYENNSNYDNSDYDD